MPKTETGPIDMRELSLDEGRELLDRAARRHLDMSGAEFVRAWDSGYFDRSADRPEVVAVSKLLPFAR